MSQIKNRISQIEEQLKMNLRAIHKAHSKSRWAALRNLSGERVQLEEQRETLLCIEESPIVKPRAIT
jgi:hypothetical protein